MMTGTKADDSVPISADAAKKEDFEVGRRKNGAAKIDYASTIEDAYDDLNKILGSDGIKRLTDDTQGLMKQQMELKFKDQLLNLKEKLQSDGKQQLYKMKMDMEQALPSKEESQAQEEKIKELEET